MMEKTTLWDPSEYLDSEEKMAAYLEAALEAGEPGIVAAAMEEISMANFEIWANWKGLNNARDGWAKDIAKEAWKTGRAIGFDHGSWISVQEMMPQDGVDIFILKKNAQTNKAQWNGKQFYDGMTNPDDLTEQVTHWKIIR